MKHELEKFKVIAFDSEWTNTFVSAPNIEQFLDVLQLSSGKNNYIIDMNADFKVEV